MFDIETIVVGEFQTNCYVVYDKKDRTSIIIDPGNDFDVIERFIDINYLTVKYVAFTHGHFDHIGAADKLAKKYNATIVIHEDDEALLKDSNLNMSKQMSNKPITVKSNNLFVVDEDRGISFSGYVFRILHTPGHTPGSICYKYNNIIFTGDTLFYNSIGNAFEPLGDINKEIESIKTKLFVLDDECICYPGHGCVTTIGLEKKQNYFLGDGFDEH